MHIAARDMAGTANFQGLPRDEKLQLIHAKRREYLAKLGSGDEPFRLEAERFAETRNRPVDAHCDAAGTRTLINKLLKQAKDTLQRIGDLGGDVVLLVASDKAELTIGHNVSRTAPTLIKFRMDSCCLIRWIRGRFLFQQCCKVSSYSKSLKLALVLLQSSAMSMRDGRQ
jgi:hypothetical protein